jgi:Tfp pilus assembly protein FimT
MNHVDNQKTQGFTLVELMLAMTFISALLLAIAMTIVQIANIYNHGMIIKDVNQTSRTISEELDRALGASTNFSIDPAARRYVNNEWGGRLCTGQYSYVWNYGSSLSEQSTNRNMYSGINVAGNTANSGSTTSSEISFVKVLDAAAAYCVPDTNGSYMPVDPANTIELLRAGDHALAVHSFSVTASDSAKDALSAQALYKVAFSLGTNDIEALNDDQTQCKPPNSPGADPNYCAVQQFTLVLRAVSGVN